MNINVTTEPVLPPPKRYILDCSEEEFRLLYYATYTVLNGNPHSKALSVLQANFVNKIVEEFGVGNALRTAKEFNLKGI